MDCPILKSIYNPAERIIVIGDLHGDYRVLIRALEISKLIRPFRECKKIRWIGGRTHLVQLGDIMDRYRGSSTDGDEMSELKMYKILFDLQDQAKEDGGYVHLILGNHELMNIKSDFRYVSTEGHQDFAEYGGRLNALRPGGPFNQLMVCRMLSAVQIGSLIFSHAGITYKISKLGIQNLNLKVQKMIQTGIYDPEILNTFWHRDYSSDPSKCHLLNRSLSNLKASGMIVGHSIHPYINSACNKRIWRVDTGMSSAFGKNRNINVLEIINGVEFNILKS